MRFRAPDVANVPLADPVRESAAREANNQRAIHSLRIYRDLRWGALLHLLLTDTRSFRTQPVYEADFAAPFRRGMPPYFASQNVVEILDAGKNFAGGNPPAEIVYGGMAIANPAAGMEAEPCWAKSRSAGFSIACADRPRDGNFGAIRSQ